MDTEASAPVALNAWVRIAPGETVTLIIDKSEMGTGSISPAFKVHVQRTKKPAKSEMGGGNIAPAFKAHAKSSIGGGLIAPSLLKHLQR
jgi:uncharacterized protein (DUF1786 family)